eukprot:5613518-Alexandrium_andersonii.AAC.1
MCIRDRDIGVDKCKQGSWGPSPGDYSVSGALPPLDYFRIVPGVRSTGRVACDHHEPCGRACHLNKQASA